MGLGLRVAGLGSLGLRVDNVSVSVSALGGVKLRG